MSSVSIASPASPLIPPLMTAEEFFKQYENKNAELIKGIVKELPVPSYKHGKICLKIGRILGNFVELHDLGHAMDNDSFVKVRNNPDSIRGADLCYISYERLPKGEIPEGLLDVVPDLVVEVRSPSHTWIEIFPKVVDYLHCGVRVVIILDAQSKTASVYRPDAMQDTFMAEQELVIPEILPGFSVQVRKLFE